MRLEVLVAIADNADNRKILEGHSVELIGSLGVAPGKVLIRVLPDGLASDIQLHVRMSRHVTWTGLQETTRLRQFNPIVIADVLELSQLK
ncbi:MAG: hypothetical protein ACREP7_12305 [Lysobacter sp.]